MTNPVSSKQDLKGHRAVITGASSGIGEQYAKQLAARGADLVIVARRLDRLKTLATQLSNQHSVQVETVELDLGQPGSSQRLYDLATADGKLVTVLVNNAGIGPYGKFTVSAAEKHAATLQLNVLALTDLCHRFVSHMLQHQKKSYITNIGSIAAFQGSSNFAVYAGSKFYVRIFSEILARELRDSKISVTCVCPGGTMTEFMDVAGQVLNDAGKPMMMTAEQVVQIGLNGMLGGKTVVVPGLINKLASLAPRFLPRKFALVMADLAITRSVSEQKK